MSWCAKCAEWGENIEHVTAASSLLFARNPTTYRGYQGVPFKYCPWCSAALRLEDRPVDSAADGIPK
jgi:hypothetical protein